MLSLALKDLPQSLAFQSAFGVLVSRAQRAAKARAVLQVAGGRWLRAVKYTPWTSWLAVIVTLGHPSACLF